MFLLTFYSYSFSSGASRSRIVEGDASEAEVRAEWRRLRDVAGGRSGVEWRGGRGHSSGVCLATSRSSTGFTRQTNTTRSLWQAHVFTRLSLMTEVRLCLCFIRLRRLNPSHLPGRITPPRLGERKGV